LAILKLQLYIDCLLLLLGLSNIIISIIIISIPVQNVTIA